MCPLILTLLRSCNFYTTILLYTIVDGAAMFTLVLQIALLCLFWVLEGLLLCSIQMLKFLFHRVLWVLQNLHSFLVRAWGILTLHPVSCLILVLDLLLVYRITFDAILDSVLRATDPDNAAVLDHRSRAILLSWIICLGIVAVIYLVVCNAATRFVSLITLCLILDLELRRSDWLEAATLDNMERTLKFGTNCVAGLVMIGIIMYNQPAVFDTLLIYLTACYPIREVVLFLTDWLEAPTPEDDLRRFVCLRTALLTFTALSFLTIRYGLTDDDVLFRLELLVPELRMHLAPLGQLLNRHHRWQAAPKFLVAWA